MPGDLSSQGDNPFFLGYREQDPTTGTSMPASKGNKRAPVDVIWSIVRKIDPSLSRHDRDLLAHMMDLNGVTELYGTPEFEGRLRQLIAEVAGSPSRIISKFQASRRAGEDV